MTRGPRRLHWEVDPASGVPVYRQMMDQIKYYAASRALAPGDQLPSIRELSATLRVNPTTVVKAYNELVHEGVIEIVHGKGAFLAAGAPRISEKNQEAALRRAARPLAVEAAQLSAPVNLVLRIVREELDVLQQEAGDRREET